MTEAVLLVVVGNLRGGAVAGSLATRISQPSPGVLMSEKVLSQPRGRPTAPTCTCCASPVAETAGSAGMLRVGLGTPELLGRALAVADKAARSKVVYCMVMENIRDWFDLGRKSVVVG